MRAGLVLMPDAAWCAAALPMLEAGHVEVLSWTFEAGWDRAMPPWVDPLLDSFAAADRLTGHGLRLSPLSAEPADEAWLARVARDCRRRGFVHVSEHFGYTTAGGFVRGAPLPVPRSRAALRVGREKLARLAEVTGGPVGLENLALAFSADDARAHGAFLGELTDGPDRFLLLDLHNLYCQAVNFDLDPETLLAAYPLERVREIHVSGGRMATPLGVPFRRDTHDGPVPAPVFELLIRVLPRCPNVVGVMLERLPQSLRTPEAADELRADFETLRAAIASAGPAECVSSIPQNVVCAPLADETESLATLQAAMLEALDEAPTAADVRARLSAEPALAPYATWLSGADLRALETARELVSTWGRRAEPG